MVATGAFAAIWKRGTSMFKHTKLHPLLAGTALLAALPLAVCAQGKEPIRIGLVTSRSGGFSTMGADVAPGLRGALAVANPQGGGGGFEVGEGRGEGGVDGRRTSLAEGDDESPPDAGGRVAEKLARDGHNLLIGPITSSISLAISQNLARWDAAFIGTISKADKLTADACNPRFVRTNHSDAMDLAMIGEWVKGIEGNDFAILAADYVWGQD